MPGVAAPERDPPAGELSELLEALATAGDEHRPELRVDVAHAEQACVTADPSLGGDVGGVRVPGDVDVAGEQRVDEALVVRVEDVVGRDAFSREVLAEPLPDRDDARVVCDRADEDVAAAAHGTGNPASALPIQLRSTALVGAMTEPARASRRNRSIGNAGV